MKTQQQNHDEAPLDPRELAYTPPSSYQQYVIDPSHQLPNQNTKKADDISHNTL